jgi:2-deoxy-D-gluconate 3-dehydrogenase
VIVRLFDLTEKKALVTGGSRGLGRGMAEGLLEAGADVAVFSSSHTIFSAAEALWQAAGRPVHPIQADLSDRAQLHRAFDESLEKLGGLDILVVNHGIQRRFPAEDFPVEDWDVILETNLTSMFLLNQLAGRVMLAQGQGKIINIASLLSFSGGFTVPAYAAAKGGVAQLTKALANEWAKRGVNVNAIAPGYIVTDSTAALVADPARNRDITARIPAGRWGQPEDLKGIVVFLASEASNYVHGVVIPVDGGWMGR